MDTGKKLNPVTFAICVLGMRLYAWQARLLMSVWSGKPTAARTPNGAGKTSIIIVVLALCMLHEFPGATVVLTSATFRQVRDQMFAALKGHEKKFTGWKFNETSIETPTGGRIVGFATDSGGRFEGFHAYPDRPLLIIVDEAKTVADGIFVAIDRCQPTHLLYISSPGGLLGRFYDAFKNSRFAHFAITAKDCPHITPEFIDAMRVQYGEDSDIYRSMVQGDFGTGTDDGRVVKFTWWERNEVLPPPPKPGKRQVFVDFADGGNDEHVIAAADGNKAWIEDSWANSLTSDQNILRHHKVLRRLQAEGYALYGDAGGVGHGYIIALGQMGVAIEPVNNNDPAADPHYFNLAAEMWWQLAGKLKNCEVILPWKDDVLKKQLLNKEEVWRQAASGEKIYGREDGRLQLMPKSKVSTKSPDRGDAIVGACFDFRSFQPVKAMGYLDPEMGRLEQASMEEGRGQIAGAYCG